MIGLFSISCRNFWASLILTTREILVKYKLITCLPKTFPVSSPFSFCSRCLYSTYFLLMVSLLALSTFYFVHLPLTNTPGHCLWHSLSIVVFYAVQCVPLVYQQYLQKSCHCLTAVAFIMFTTLAIAFVTCRNRHHMRKQCQI